MRIMTVTLGTALVLCNLGTLGAAAHAQAQVVREPRERPIIRVPVVRTTPYWDYNIVFHDIVIDLRTTGSIHTARP
jgi:hypothetical protein